MNRRGFLLGVLLSTFLASTGCSANDDPPDYRYRLTVEVETPEGLKSGSSVLEVELMKVRPAMHPSGVGLSSQARGEAVAVDLPNGQTLYALLRSENKVDWASNIVYVMAPRREESTPDEAMAERFDWIRNNREVILLPRYKLVAKGTMRLDGWPMLVTFDDISDPTSIKKVDPFNLAATFGEGVELKRITVQVTDDPVTTGIEQRLEWLGQLKEMNLEVDDFPADIPLGNFSGMFRKGV
ncbi:hypothetical protein [uncultured Erythrobacter sp.]|uniref:hypothetical protein n=1 Tax=uncultured Erythrobacter sp. TaxID=263913 RepID=UPI00261FE26A|nr:hypothetical protein [uncultured Erythrobacter sp.]